MKGWVKLIDAVVELARKDAAEGGRWGSDAEVFLASDWCDELVSVSRDWKADCDRRRVYK